MCQCAKIVALLSILTPTVFAYAEAPQSVPQSRKYEFGLNQGRLESLGNAHDLFESGEWIEIVAGWRPGFLKPLNLQMRLGVSNPGKKSNKIVYFFDSTSAIVAEDISTSVSIMSLGVDYPIILNDKPKMSLRLGIGINRTKLGYVSIIKGAVIDSVYFDDKKSKDLSRTFVLPYLRGGLELMFDSQFGAIAELMFLRIPNAYQTGGFALGQFGPKRNMHYLVVSVDLVFKL